MIISDLEILEVIREEDARIQGGIAFADAKARANASGNYFAATDTRTSTNAYSSYYYYPSSSASSRSSSSSAAY